MRLTAILLTAIAACLAAPAVAAARWRPAVPLPPHPPTRIYEACPVLSGWAAACAQLGVTDRCPDQHGCVFLPRPADRYDRMHELGHIFDFQVLTDLDRRRFIRMLRLPAGEWGRYYDDGLGHSMPSNYSPTEWFADAYAHCALKLDGRPDRHGIYTSVVAYWEPATPRQYDRLCAAIKFVALSG